MSLSDWQVLQKIIFGFDFPFVILDNNFTSEIWRLIAQEILRLPASFPEFSDLTDNGGERGENTLFVFLWSAHCCVISSGCWIPSGRPCPVWTAAWPYLIYSIHKHHRRVLPQMFSISNLNTKMKFYPDICLSDPVCPWHRVVMN